MLDSPDRIKSTPQETDRSIPYLKFIIEAITSSPEGKATITEIFFYLGKKYPGKFSESLSSTWQSSIRQVLSRDRQFIRLKRRRGCKYGEWLFFPTPQIKMPKKEHKDFSLYKNWRKELIKQGAYKEFYRNQTKKNES